MAAALPDFVLAFVFLATWIRPAAMGQGRLGHVILVMLLEFIIIHSAAFMGQVLFAPGSRVRRAWSVVGLGAFYSLFVVGFALAFKSAWPLWSFWGLTLNRMLSVLVGQAPEGEEREFLQRGWAACALAYLVFTFATIVLPVPRLGITPEVVRTSALQGHGLWVDQPWRVLALGFLYFSAVGLSELFDHRWLGARKAAPPTEAGADPRAAA